MHFATSIAIYVLLLNLLKRIYYNNPLRWWYTCDFIYSASKNDKNWTLVQLRYLNITLLRLLSIEISDGSDFIRNAVFRDILLHNMRFDELPDLPRGFQSDRRSSSSIVSWKTWYKAIHTSSKLVVFTEGGGVRRMGWISHNFFILIKWQISFDNYSYSIYSCHDEINFQIICVRPRYQRYPCDEKQRYNIFKPFKYKAMNRSKLL